jgi:diphthine methyl ester synthase
MWRRSGGVSIADVLSRRSGLSNETDITLRGLATICRCARIYLEAYTSVLMVSQDRLEAFYQKLLILADREMVESSANDIL